MSIAKERWRWVPGYEGLYMVSDMGNVSSVPNSSKDGVLLTGRPSNNGYLRVGLYRDGFYRWVSIHRLVAKAFVPNPDDKPQVNHKDGDKTNNRADNLEWATPTENIRHAYEVLHRPPSNKTSKCRRFSDDQVRAIRNDKRKASFLAKEYGVSRQTIADIRKRKYYKEVV